MQQHHCVKKIPSRSRRWCRRWAVLSWFCRRRGFPGGYTTAAYKDQMCGTVGRKRVQLITRNCATTETLGGDRVTVRNPNQPSRMRLQWALKQKKKQKRKITTIPKTCCCFFFFFNSNTDPAPYTGLNSETHSHSCKLNQRMDKSDRTSRMRQPWFYKVIREVRGQGWLSLWPLDCP